ncbi:MAG: hypothetical protein LUH05_07575 [Candidatus Gastranaerophilales bacterium]|nr:hypothetical protein [Candidatus Gastranaerophilales bacterium]
MPIEGFDYKAFSIDLAKQALEVLMQPNSNAAPDTLSEQDKKNIVETVRKFCFMSGEALSKDAQLKFTAEQASLVTQFIGEWAFHKSIDLIKGKIPQQNRDAILQIIAANIFNTAKLALIKKMPQDAIITLVEEKVKQVYTEELKKLVKKGILSQQQYDLAVNTSNLNDMVQKTEDESNLKKAGSSGDEQTSSTSDKKVLKLAALAIVLKNLPENKANEILNSLDKQDVQHVINYMKMSNIEDKIDHQVIIKSIEEIRKILPVSDFVNVPKILKGYYKMIKMTPPDVLSELAVKERESVKDFILDTSFPAEKTFSPLVIQSLVKIIEEKINDN